MDQNGYVDVTIEGPLLLGQPPAGLVELAHHVAKLGEQVQRSVLRVNWRMGWCDLTALSHFGLLLVRAAKCFDEVRVRLDKPPEDWQVRYLRQIGFWHILQPGAVGSRLTCDPYPLPPEITTEIRTNSTEFFIPAVPTPQSATASSESVGAWMSRFDGLLRATIAFNGILDTELARSREYLYLLLWELVQNASKHAHTRDLAVIGQVFLHQNRLDTCLRNLPEDQERDVRKRWPVIARSMAAQYSLERDNCVLGRRKQWLQRHSDQSFLLLSCVDLGLGIPGSLAGRGVGKDLGVDVRLKMAFDPLHSLGFARDCEVHGLSQVAQLVWDYDGYFHFHSGSEVDGTLTSAVLEGCVDQQKKQAEMHSSAAGKVSLPGTLAQILLPFSPPANQVRRYAATALATSRRGAKSLPKGFSPLVAWQVFRNAGLSMDMAERHPRRAACALSGAASRTVREQGCDVLYLDVACLPRDRQFLSTALRRIRKMFEVEGRHGVVILNASPGLFEIAQSLVKLSAGEPPHWDNARQDLSTHIPRGAMSEALPLLLPVTTSSREYSKVAWLGLSHVKPGYREALNKALNFLYENTGWHQMDALVREASTCVPEKQKEVLHTFPDVIRLTARRHPWLLSVKSVSGVDSVTLLLDRDNVFQLSLGSLLLQVQEDIKTRALHDNRLGLPYRLGWHEPPQRYREVYYRTWPVLSDRNALRVCADLLIRLAHNKGIDLPNVRGVVAVTPSAGLLAREIAASLRVSLWETPSVHEIEEPDWLPHDVGGVLIVDDVYDTGWSTAKLEGRLRRANGRCLGILTMLRSTEPDRPDHADRLVWAHVVDLKPLDPAQVADKECYEVDPHTLEPVSPKSRRSGEPVHQDSGEGETRQTVARLFAARQQESRISSVENDARLQRLVDANAIRSGHFVYQSHHYDLYFSLADALQDADLSLSICQWIEREMLAVTRDGMDVVLVYPYYSPVHILIGLLARRWPNNRLQGRRIHLVVARPSQLTGDRIGYAVPQWPREVAAPVVVFLDDAIASGETLAGVIDAVLPKLPSGILKLVVFDRIGLRTRRHLQRVRGYLPEQITSLAGGSPPPPADSYFSSFVRAGIRAGGKLSCLQCKVLADLRELREKITALRILDAQEPLSGLFRPTIVQHAPAAESNRLDSAQTKATLLFRAMAYADVISGPEIWQEVCKYTGLAQLEALLTILLDRRLCRQVTQSNQADVMRTIGSCLSGDIPPAARYRFLLMLPYCVDPEFACSVLSHAVPDSIASRRGTGSVVSALREAAVEEISVASGAFRHLIRGMVEPTAPTAMKEFADRWDDLLSHAEDRQLRQWIDDVLEPGEGGALRFERVYELALRFGTRVRKRHPTELPRKLFNYQKFLVQDPSRRQLANLVKLVPEGSFEWFIAAVRAAQRLAYSDDVDTKLLDELLRMDQQWRGMFRAKLPQSDYADIVRRVGDGLAGLGLDERAYDGGVLDHLVTDITPDVMEVVGHACRSAKSDLQSEPQGPIWIGEGSGAGVHVLLKTGLLRDIISNLLKNVRDRCADASVKVSVGEKAGDPSRILVMVQDDVPVTEAELEGFFARSASNLALLRIQVRRWDGDMYVEKLAADADRVTAKKVIVEVHRVNPESKEKLRDERQQPHAYSTTTDTR